jgi:hypothetical protein
MSPTLTNKKYDKDTLSEFIIQLKERDACLDWHFYLKG